MCLIFVCQQPIRKYFNNENFPIYGTSILSDFTVFILSIVKACIFSAIPMLFAKYNLWIVPLGTKCRFTIVHAVASPIHAMCKVQSKDCVSAKCGSMLCTRIIAQIVDPYIDCAGQSCVHNMYNNYTNLTLTSTILFFIIFPFCTCPPVLNAFKVHLVAASLRKPCTRASSCLSEVICFSGNSIP